MRGQICQQQWQQQQQQQQQQQGEPLGLVSTDKI